MKIYIIVLRIQLFFWISFLMNEHLSLWKLNRHRTVQSIKRTPNLNTEVFWGDLTMPPVPKFLCLNIDSDHEKSDKKTKFGDLVSHIKYQGWVTTFEWGLPETPSINQSLMRHLTPIVRSSATSARPAWSGRSWPRGTPSTAWAWRWIGCCWQPGPGTRRGWPGVVTRCQTKMMRFSSSETFLALGNCLTSSSTRLGPLCCGTG